MLKINAGSASELNPDDPTFEAANQSCRSLLPHGGNQEATVPSQQLAKELKWASCVRSHGLPSFPDPNSQGAFVHSQIDQYIDQFDAKLPLAVHAAKACRSYQPTESIPAVVGNL